LNLTLPTLPLRSVILAVVVGAALLLGACARYTEGTNLTCPRAVFVGGADTQTRFAPGAARTAANITADVELSDMQYTCRVATSRAVANLNFTVAGTRRDTSGVADIDVPYFVAVTDATGAIIAKHNFSARLHFLAGVGTVSSVQRIEEKLPLAAGQRAVGFEQMVGIQLSREDLDYNLAGR
jgi:hypothetical protein